MKITIAYIAEEEQKTAAVLAALLRLLPDAKVRKSLRNAPYLHIYLAAGQAKNLRKLEIKKN